MLKYLRRGWSFLYHYNGKILIKGISPCFKGHCNVVLTVEHETISGAIQLMEEAIEMERNERTENNT